MKRGRSEAKGKGERLSKGIREKESKIDGKKKDMA